MQMTGRRSTPLSVKCERCGKDFETYSCEGAKFCGAKCRYAHNLAEGREARRKALRAQMESCPVCDKRFVQDSAKPRLYCSQRCNKKAWKIRNREKTLRDTFYDFAVSKLDGNYLSALGRDQFECVRCGAQSVLVHHQDNRGEKCKLMHPNNDLSNLVTLCDPCHRKEHQIAWVFDGKSLIIQCKAFEAVMGTDLIKISKTEVML